MVRVDGRIKNNSMRNITKYDDLEVLGDSTHKSIALKPPEFTVTYYITTTTLKFGERARIVRDAFYKEIGIETTTTDEDASPPLLSSSPTFDQQEHSGVAMELFKAAISRIEKQISSLKENLTSSSTSKDE